MHYSMLWCQILCPHVNKDTIQIFKFSGSGKLRLEGENSRASHPLYETLNLRTFCQKVLAALKYSLLSFIRLTMISIKSCIHQKSILYVLKLIIFRHCLGGLYSIHVYNIESQAQQGALRSSKSCRNQLNSVLHVQL